MTSSLFQRCYRKSPRPKFFAFQGMLAVIVFCFGSCDESLPDFEEPSRVFEAKIAGIYSLTATDNSLRAVLTVTNAFDETFQGTAYLKGSIEIQSARDAEVKKSFTLGSADIVFARNFDRQTGSLIVDPKDSIQMRVSWNFMDDTGRDLRADFFKYVEDVTCPGRCLAYTEDFILRGNVTVYQKTGPVYARATPFALCFVSLWVRPNDCPPILSGDPCNLRPPQPLRGCFPNFSSNTFEENK